MQVRQRLFYDVLVLAHENDKDEWLSKRTIARRVNALRGATLYELNESPLAHDVCSLMNTDRIAINTNPDYEKIILVKDNKFKVSDFETEVTKAVETYFKEE